MTKEADDLYVLDLGILEPVEPEPSAESSHSPESSEASTEDRTASKFTRVLGSGRRALELGRAIVAEVAAGEASSQREAGRRRGLSKSGTRDHVALTRLADNVQTELLAEQAEHVSADRLLRTILRQPADAQLTALKEAEHHCRTSSHGGPWRASADRLTTTSVRRDAPPRVRAVGYFNPEMWHHQRTRAAHRLDRINQFVASLNDKLARTSANRTADQVSNLIARYLDRQGHVTAFDVTVESVSNGAGATVFRATVTPNDDWRRRRSLDGFSLLVAHPKVTASAVELVRLYRAKDVVEKDFQIIKSLLKLRPVWHHNDAKVRAHVTLCMLALALERLLQERLANTTTVAAALEDLATCCLQRYRGSAPADEVYTATRPNEAQAKILKKLALSHLTEPAYLSTAITPRHQL